MQESASLTSSSPDKTWTETRRGRIVIMASMLGLFVLVFWMAMKSRQMLASRAGLVVDEQYLSFGEVWETEQLDLDLPITNTTKRAIDVTGFLLSCECLEIQPDSLTIPPGETRICHLKLNLLARQDQNIAAATDFAKGGPATTRAYKRVNVKIVPVTAGSTSWQQGWVIHGSVRQMVSFKPAQVSFTESLVKGMRYPSAAVKVAVKVPVENVIVDCDPHMAKFSLERLENSLTEYILRIAPKEELPIGLFAFPIRLRVITGKGETLQSRSLFVRGEVVEDVQAIPSRLYLGSHAIGKAVSETVLLRSNSGSNFEVDGIENENPDVTIKPSGDYRSGGKSFRIVQIITGSGWHQRKVQFIIQHGPGERSQKIKVPLQWSFYVMGKP